MGAKSKFNLTRHHLIPTCRGEEDKRVVKIPDFFHCNWHQIFGIMTADEAIEYIEYIFGLNSRLNTKKIWSQQELFQLYVIIMQKALKNIFDLDLLEKLFKRNSTNDSNIQNFSLPSRFNLLWYHNFSNLTPKQTIEFIEIIFKGKGQKRKISKWTWGELLAIRRTVKRIAIRSNSNWIDDAITRIRKTA